MKSFMSFPLWSSHSVCLVSYTCRSSRILDIHVMKLSHQFYILSLSLEFHTWYKLRHNLALQVSHMLAIVPFKKIQIWFIQLTGNFPLSKIIQSSQSLSFQNNSLWGFSVSSSMCCISLRPCIEIERIIKNILLTTNLNKKINNDNLKFKKKQHKNIPQ